MQQPELLPAHHPAGFSICELMAERHRTAHCKLFLLRKKPQVKIKADTREIYYVTKCGWLPNVSSNFSKKEMSQVSPGLRHSSFCNYWHHLFLFFCLCLRQRCCPALIKTHLAYQNGDDAFVLLLYQVTDDFVVKVLHRLPLRNHIWQRKFVRSEMININECRI